MGVGIAVLTCYLDTNVVIYLAKGRTDVLNKKVRELMEASDLLISPMVLFELQQLFELGRLKGSAESILSSLNQAIGLEICQLPMATIVSHSQALSWTRDPGDRLIVANAQANFESPLITRDRNIQEHYSPAVW